MMLSATSLSSEVWCSPDIWIFLETPAIWQPCFTPSKSCCSDTALLGVHQEWVGVGPCGLFSSSLPLSFLLATLYSIWKTKIISLLAQSLAVNREREGGREGWKEGGRERGKKGEGERERDESKKEHRTILVSFPRQRWETLNQLHTVVLLSFSTCSHSRGSHRQAQHLCESAAESVQRTA